MTERKVMERSEIETMIPHRPPFLWIDRVEELEPGVRCVAVKFVDPADPMFTGHFPDRPILPGVLSDRSGGADRGSDAGIGRFGPVRRDWSRLAGGGKPLQVSQARDSGAGAAH